MHCPVYSVYTPLWAPAACHSRRAAGNSCSQPFALTRLDLETTARARTGGLRRLPRPRAAATPGRGGPALSPCRRAVLPAPLREREPICWRRRARADGCGRPRPARAAADPRSAQAACPPRPSVLVASPVTHPKTSSPFATSPSPPHFVHPLFPRPPHGFLCSSRLTHPFLLPSSGYWCPCRRPPPQAAAAYVP